MKLFSNLIVDKQKNLSCQNEAIYLPRINPLNNQILINYLMFSVNSLHTRLEM
jgi:hypothetical protein